MRLEEEAYKAYRLQNHPTSLAQNITHKKNICFNVPLVVLAWKMLLNFSNTRDYYAAFHLLLTQTTE